MLHHFTKNATIPRNTLFRTGFCLQRSYSNGLLSKFDRTPSFRVAECPNPFWQLGDGISGDKEDPLEAQWNADVQRGWKSWTAADLTNR